MASWIVHLRLADNLLKRIPGLDPVQFGIGNIAPDSGIPDEKYEKFTPPTEVTHFPIPEGAPWIHADLDFYRGYLKDLARPGENPKQFSFRLGYFFHLLTDNLWRIQVVIPTKSGFAAQFDADKDFIWEVKRDWYGLDFVYLRDYPDSYFYQVFLDANPTETYLEFLPLDALQFRVAHIQTMYQRTDDKVQELYKRPFIYLSKAQMDQFILESTKTLRRIYQVLWDKEPVISDQRSALALLE